MTDWPPERIAAAKAAWWAADVEAQAALAEIERLQVFETWARLNGLHVKEAEKRADWIIEQMLGGLLWSKGAIENNRETVRGYLIDQFRETAAKIESLQARVAELSERLEITHVYQGGDGDDHLRRVDLDEPLPEYCDGISCRDETIRLQDEELDRARERDERLKQLLQVTLSALESLEQDALGWVEGQIVANQREEWPLRDELIARIRAELGERP